MGNCSIVARMAPEATSDPPKNGLKAQLAAFVVRTFESLGLRGAPTLMGLLERIPALRTTLATVRLPYGELVTFPAFDPYWSRYLWAEVPFERDVEQIFRKLGAGRVLLDCGANIGYWTVRAREFGFTEVIAVEANSQLIPMLRENVRLNAIQGTVHHAAVYSQSGIDLFLDNSRAHQQAGIGDSGIPVVSITIADMLEEIPPDREAIAKLDVEGSEIAAIEGAKGHEKTIIVYEDFRQFGMPVTKYVLGQNLRVFGVSPSGEHVGISSVDEALAFNSRISLPRWPSNFVACWPAQAAAVERQLR